jgi:hypothetical protein
MGPIGVTGPQGPVGATGAQGAQGPKGDDGATGAEGSTGPKGATGAQGPQGIAGNDGATGAKGATGPAGPAGPEGPSGEDGATGPQGPQGDAGAKGATGPTGAQGAQGQLGATGPQGPQGQNGATGPQGQKGDQGEKGAQGVTGPTGAQGATGPQGQKGDQGDPGAKGATGPEGQKGATGAEGSKGATGAEGSKGATGAEGPKGVTGAEGSKGATGATGPAGSGATGPTGPAGPVGEEGRVGAARYGFLTNTEETDPGSGKVKFGPKKTLGEMLALFPVTDNLQHASQPADLTTLPWSVSPGFWSLEGWSPESYGTGPEAGSRSGYYWNTEKLKGNVTVGLKKANGLLTSPRQFSVWLFTEGGAKPSGYQLAVISETSSLVTFVLRKWVNGVETPLAESKEVPFADGDSFYLTSFGGKLSMWRRAGTGTPVTVGTEVTESTFTEGYSGFDGNGSNPRLVNFTTRAIPPLNSVSTLVLSETDGDSGPLGPYIATWDDSDSEPRGFITLRKVSTPSSFAIFKLVSDVTDKGSWDSIPVELVTSGGATFAGSDMLNVDFDASGDQGAMGATGATGVTGATGATGAAGTSDLKDSVRVATTGNVVISTALNAGDVIDGVTLVNGDRVLVQKQTTKSENGIWVAGAVPARATDADGGGELSGGTMVYVEEGTLYGDRAMRITTNGSISPGVTAHDWTPLGPRSEGGEVEVETTPGSVKSAVLTVNHKLGVVPSDIQLTAQRSEAAEVLFEPVVIEGSATATQFKIRGLSSGPFASAVKVKVYWRASVE